MRVKIFDFEHERDLEYAINEFIVNKRIVDIKYSVSIGVFSEEQIYCFTALVMYEESDK